jgi:hypothetical protein
MLLRRLQKYGFGTGGMLVVVMALLIAPAGAGAVVLYDQTANVDPIFCY